MRSCFGCLALFVLIIVVSYDAWLAVGWLLDTFFDMGGTLPGIMLQVFGAGIIHALFFWPSTPVNSHNRTSPNHQSLSFAQVCSQLLQ